MLQHHKIGSILHRSTAKREVDHLYATFAAAPAVLSHSTPSCRNRSTCPSLTTLRVVDCVNKTMNAISYEA